MTSSISAEIEKPLSNLSYLYSISTPANEDIALSALFKSASDFKETIYFAPSPFAAEDIGITANASVKPSMADNIFLNIISQP